MNQSPNKTALLATLHCLTGCAIGEIVGMIISTVWAWQALPSVLLSIALAFVFGYSLSMLPLLRGGLAVKQALGLALAADTVSIAVMEIVDNGFILVVPGAIHAELISLLFWTSLGLSLVIAFLAAFPVNKYLIAHDKGHAVVHEFHHSHHEHHH
jgi:hypothetical protein